MQFILIKLILLYKKILSPIMGNQCRFYPTCSSYGIEAIESHGSLYGSYLTIKRICRCNPIFEGGFDPVPKNSKNREQK